MGAEGQAPLAAFRCFLKWGWLFKEGFNEVKRSSSPEVRTEDHPILVGQVLY